MEADTGDDVDVPEEEPNTLICCVPNCTFTELHHLPKEASVRDDWLKMLGVESSTNQSCICTHHVNTIINGRFLSRGDVGQESEVQPTSEIRNRSDSTCDETALASSTTNETLAKYKRKMIIEMQILKREKVEDVWPHMKRRMGADCKWLWDRMRKVTFRKLTHLSSMGDQVGRLPAIAHMTPVDWEIVDLCLMYDNVNLMSAASYTNYEELRGLISLFHLVQKYNIENCTDRIQLAARWVRLQQSYNTNKREVSGLLLQKRWYELKKETREKFYVFWAIFFKPRVRSDQPKPIHLSVAKRYPEVVTQEFASWEEMIEKGLVIPTNELEETARQMDAGILPTVDEDLHFDLEIIEPDIEIIDLEKYVMNDSNSYVGEPIQPVEKPTDGEDTMGIEVKSELLDSADEEDDVIMLPSDNEGQDDSGDKALGRNDSDKDNFGHNNPDKNDLGQIWSDEGGQVMPVIQSIVTLAKETTAKTDEPVTSVATLLSDNEDDMSPSNDQPNPKADSQEAKTDVPKSTNTEKESSDIEDEEDEENDIIQLDDSVLKSLEMEHIQLEKHEPEPEVIEESVDKKLLMLPVVVTQNIDVFLNKQTENIALTEEKCAEIIEFSKKRPKMPHEVQELKKFIENVYRNSDKFKKVYSSVSLCKNPDFNTRLKRITSAFMLSQRNVSFLRRCKPLTIDLFNCSKAKKCADFDFPVTVMKLPAEALINSAQNIMQDNAIPKNNIIKPTSPDNVHATSVTSDSVHGSSSSSDNVNVTSDITDNAYAASDSTDNAYIASDSSENIQGASNDEVEIIEGVSDKPRPKSVKLQDIEDVRRTNSKLKTALIPPITLNQQKPGKGKKQSSNFHMLMEMTKPMPIVINKTPEMAAEIVNSMKSKKTKAKACVSSQISWLDRHKKINYGSALITKDTLTKMIVTLSSEWDTIGEARFCCLARRHMLIREMQRQMLETDTGRKSYMKSLIKQWSHKHKKSPCKCCCKDQLAEKTAQWQEEEKAAQAKTATAKRNADTRAKKVREKPTKTLQEVIEELGDDIPNDLSDIEYEKEVTVKTTVKPKVSCNIKPSERRPRPRRTKRKSVVHTISSDEEGLRGTQPMGEVIPAQTVNVVMSDENQLRLRLQDNTELTIDVNSLAPGIVSQISSQSINGNLLLINPTVLQGIPTFENQTYEAGGSLDRGPIEVVQHRIEDHAYSVSSRNELIVHPLSRNENVDEGASIDVDESVNEDISEPVENSDSTDLEKKNDSFLSVRNFAKLSSRNDDQKNTTGCKLSSLLQQCGIEFGDGMAELTPNVSHTPSTSARPDFNPQFETVRTLRKVYPKTVTESKKSPIKIMMKYPDDMSQMETIDTTKHKLYVMDPNTQEMVPLTGKKVVIKKVFPQANRMAIRKTPTMTDEVIELDSDGENSEVPVTTLVPGALPVEPATPVITTESPSAFLNMQMGSAPFPDVQAPVVRVIDPKLSNIPVPRIIRAKSILLSPEQRKNFMPIACAGQITEEDELSFFREEEELKKMKRKRKSERQKEYYYRQKDLKNNEIKIKKERRNKEKEPKSNAERQREFRPRNAEKPNVKFGMPSGKRVVVKGHLIRSHDGLSFGLNPTPNTTPPLVQASEDLTKLSPAQRALKNNSLPEVLYKLPPSPNALYDNPPNSVGVYKGNWPGNVRILNTDLSSNEQRAAKRQKLSTNKKSKKSLFIQRQDTVQGASSSDDEPLLELKKRKNVKQVRGVPINANIYSGDEVMVVRKNTTARTDTAHFVIQANNNETEMDSTLELESGVNATTENQSIKPTSLVVSRTDDSTVGSGMLMQTALPDEMDLQEESLMHEQGMNDGADNDDDDCILGM